MYQKPTDIINSELLDVDNYIQKILTNNQNYLTNYFQNYILNGSKKLRSTIAILAIKALGHKPTVKQLSICAISEIIHNASLIHDDIIDNSNLRRGKSSFNSDFGNSVAVIAGDFLISIVLKELFILKNELVMNNFIKMFSKLCNGEIYQFENKNKIISLEKYLNKSELKTAELFKTSLFSVFAAENQSEYYDFAKNFGKNFGIAFQLNDDIDNFYSSYSNKPIYSDFNNGICTLPMILYANEKNITDYSKISISDLENSLYLKKSADLCKNYANAALDLLKDFADNQYTNALKILCKNIRKN